MSKFYYINKDGVKKEFGGLHMYDPELNSYVGLLTNTIISKDNYLLNLHPAINGVEGYSSYYTYVNKDGKQVKYDGVIKTNKLGNKYFTYTSNSFVNLNHTKIISGEPITYYTYTSETGEDLIWTNKVNFNRNKNTYYGVR